MGQKRLTTTNYIDSWSQALKQAALDAPITEKGQFEPILIDMRQQKASVQLEDVIKNNPIAQVIDSYDEQLAELYISKNAQLFKANKDVVQHSIKEYLRQHYGNKAEWRAGTWVYYPWNGLLVHALQEEDYWELRTIRNQILVSKQEQSAFKNFNISCAGMSVGSNGAAGIVLTSGSKQIKLADGAVFSGSNLNRARTGLKNVGLNKCIVMARELYEMNPYIKVKAFTDNIDANSLEEFFAHPWKTDLIVDEIDDIELKVRLRVEAKKRAIPVIMVTEPGNQVMVDVERFDLDRSLPIFHGLTPGIEKILENGGVTNDREKIKYVATIIGVKNLPIRDQQAMTKVGSEIPSPPQLGSTAMLAGGVIAYVARQIATQAPIKSGRHVISLDHELIEGALSYRNKRVHRKHSQALMHAIDSM